MISFGWPVHHKQHEANVETCLEKCGKTATADALDAVLALLYINIELVQPKIARTSRTCMRTQPTYNGGAHVQNS
jgi:hypothetical protein